MSALARELELERELRIRRARTHFLSFVQHTMPTYQTNWHHVVMANALQRVADGTCKRLILTCPPRHGKSQQVSMHFPAFLLGVNPRSQIIAASYNATLASRMNRAVQRLMDSPAYAQVFPNTYLNSANVRSSAAGNWLRNSDEFETVNFGGLYRSTGVGGSATGYGMSCGICDDPTRNRQDASSPTYQQRLMDWFQSTFFTRLEKDGALIIVLTRWSERDIAGQLLELQKNNPDADKWDVVNLPALAEKDRHPDDHREVGQALWPAKYNEKRLKQIAATIGEREFVSLYQQRPAPAEGAIVKASDVQWFDVLPGRAQTWTIAVDLTFEDREDFCAFAVFACDGPNHYLVEMVERRMAFTEQIATLEMLLSQYAGVRAVLVELSANAAALIDVLRKKVGGLIPVRVTTSKENRLAAVSPVFEAHNFYVQKKAAWADKFVVQLTTFPAAKNDDMVDAVSLYLNYALKKNMDYGRMTQLSQPRQSPARWR